MSALTPYRRIANLFLENPTEDFEGFSSEGESTEQEYICPPCRQAAPIKVNRLVPSGTTPSWVVNRFTWFQRQPFSEAHEYAHFAVHILGERYPQEVVNFCSQHHLADKLDLVLELIGQAFPEAQSITVGMEQDPESDKRWIMVDVVVSGTAKEIRLRHRDCVRRLLRLLAWPLSTLIRTTYTLA